MEPKKCSAFFKSLTSPKRWEDLKTFGSSCAIRTAYFWFVFVPIAAKILAPLAGTKAVLFGFTLQVSLPFAWQCFFFAALCFSAANLIYDIRCPWIVKQFAQPAEFLAGGFTRLRLVMELERMKEALESIRNEDSCDMTDLQRLLSGKIGFEETNPDELRNFYIALHTYANHIHRGSRRIATWLYFAGFALLAIVVVQNIESVIRAISPPP